MQPWSRLVVTVGLTISLSLAAGLGATGTSEASSAQTVHTVQPGDTLWKLSRRYGTTVRDLRALNRLWTTTTIHPGRQLLIPRPGERVHVVSTGESLWLIANWYGLTVPEIMQANGLSDHQIRSGQPLRIPAGRPSPTPPANDPQSTQPSQPSDTSRASRVQAVATDQELLARVISSEAAAEPYLGQVAVGAVVLNRVLHPSFPNTLHGVVYQKGQFEPVMNGRIHQPPTPSARRAASEASRGVDPTGGALYFFNARKVSHPFFATRQFLTRIGNHWFYR